MRQSDLLILAFLAFVLVAVPSTASGLIVVDDDWAGADHSTIQDALDEASPGETIRVHAGYYEEELVAGDSVIIVGNGTGTIIVTDGTALTGGDGISVSGVLIESRDGLSIGDDATVESVVLEVTGTGISAGLDALILAVVQDGGSIEPGQGSNLTDCTFTDVLLNLTSDSGLAGSDIHQNGILLQGDGNTVTECDIRDSTIELQGTANLVYDNVLRANDVTDPGGNAWNVTPVSGENVIGGDILGGNFWYEYAGEDADSDGIGDTAHRVAPGVFDRAPLVYLPTPPSLSSLSAAPANASYRTAREFSLVYTDMNNDPAEYVRAVFEGFVVVLTAADLEEPLNGTRYNSTSTIPAGNLTFHYEASDGAGSVSTPDLQIISTNSPPVLTLSVSPQTGNRNDEITVEVNYSDADDDAPQSLKAEAIGLLDTIALELQEDDPLDEVFSDGKSYSATSKFEPDEYAVRVSGSDGSTNRTSAAEPLVIRNAPPELVGSAAPLSGTAETIFNFSVMYRDIDGDPPTEVHVRLGPWEFPLTTLGQSDFEHWVEYFTERSVPKGTYQYSFDAMDSAGNENQTRNRTLIVQNTPPVITGVSVSKLNGLDNFNVTVNDVDGEQPTYARLHVDSEQYDMDPAGGEDHTFYFVKTLFVPEGVHEFYVQVADEIASDVSEISYINATGYPRLLSPTIDPAAPESSDLVTFRVTYRHEEGIAATYVLLLVDGDTYGMEKVSGEARTGAVYEALLRFARGEHTFSFNASDGDLLNITLPRTFIVSNTPPEATLSAIPAVPSPGSNVRFTLSFSDHDGDSPIGTRFDIDGERLVLGSEEIGAGEWVLTGTASLSKGSHFVSVRYGDGIDNRTMTWWFPVDSPPAFNSTEWRREDSLNVTVNVSAADADGDPLTAWIVLDDTAYPLSPINASDANTTDGIEFTLTMPFPEGHVTYRIVVNDTVMEIGEDREIDILLVVNTPPRLKELSHYVMSNDPRQVRFQVHYIDPDGDLAEKVVLVIESDPEVWHVMSSAGNGADAYYSTAQVTLSPGTYHYHVFATDGRDVTVSGSSSILILEVPGPVQPSKEEADPLEPVWAILGNTIYLMLLMAVIVLVGVAAGVMSRSRSGPGPAAGGQMPQAQAQVPSPPKGPTWPPVTGPQAAVGQGRSQTREVEFEPAQVEFSPGSQGSGPISSSDGSPTWRPRGRPSAGPFVPSFPSFEEEAEVPFRPSEDQWERFLDEESSDESAPVDMPARRKGSGADRAWGQEGQTGAEDVDGWGDANGWGDADGWTREDTPSGGWEKPTGPGRAGAREGDTPEGGGDSWESGATVKELTPRKPRSGFGMFDDVEQIDVGDWKDEW